MDIEQIKNNRNIGRKIEIFRNMKQIMLISVLLNLCLLSFSQENKSLSSIYKSFEVDEIPLYPYGRDSLEKYLRMGLGTVDLTECQGTAMISFVVEPDGSLTGFKTIRSVCPYVDKKLIELASKMPRWTSGKKEGTAVRTEVNIPFIIKVEKLKISN